jgi:hypothetical protein
MDNWNLSFLSLFSVILAVCGSTAQSATPDYFVIKSVKIRQVSGPPMDQSVPTYDQTLPLPIVLPSPGTSGSPGAGDTEGGIFSSLDVIGVGKEIWSIVEANQPALNANIYHYSALPPHTTPDQLEHWSDPKKSEFQMIYTNKLGMDVVKLSYMIMFQYGGALKGTGKYVANASVIPTHIAVDWGYKIDAQVQNFPPTNVGSDQNPIAMIQMALKWTVSSEFNKEQDGASYNLDGNGRIIPN